MIVPVKPFFMAGTLLNTAAILVGALVGILGGGFVDASKPGPLIAIGLLTACLGIKMFLGISRVLLVIGVVVVGAFIGNALKLDTILANLASHASQLVQSGKEGQAGSGLVAAVVLFCVGPMTLLGCVQDAVERKIDILAMKSLLDGISSVLLGALFGSEILLAALAVLIIQGIITFAAKPFAKMAQDQELMNDFTAVGGVLLLGIGLRITIKTAEIPVEQFLPALIVGPIASIIARRVISNRQASTQVP